MKIVSSEEMGKIDRIAINDYGIPSELLMGLAGKGCAEIIMKRYPEAHKAAVICGTGNNGGDGFCAAYYLKNSGRNPIVYITGNPEKISGAALTYKKICDNSSIPVKTIEDASELNDDLDLIIEAVFGTGFQGEVKEFHKTLFHEMSISSTPVVSLDMPGGLPSEGPIGSLYCVKADLTITIGLPKLSLVTYPGKRYTGELEILDIGFPEALTTSSSLKNNLVNKEYIRDILSEIKRDIEDHKYKRGHLLIAGGFEGMEGAALLAARAALETGAGLVTILTEQKSRPVIAGRIPEVMTTGINSYPSDGNGTIADEISSLFKNKKINAVLIGPGLGRTETARIMLFAIINELQSRPDIPLVADGDALFHISPLEKPLFESRKNPVLLTPHLMEGVRLLGADRDEVEKYPAGSAKKTAINSTCAVTFKGPATITTDGEELFVNTTGSSNLAAAGSGDVLAGIAATLALNLPPLQAGTAAAYIHGRAGDLLFDSGFPVSKAGDLIPKIKEALKETLNE